MSGHPHIVEVFDGGVRADGQAFLVMPYYDGGSLAGRLKSTGPMPWPAVTDIGVRLAGALQAAHDAGILHRDLKPDNILLDDYDGPRLADFGQARLTDAELTRTGETAITPGFTAPEVLNGGRATVASDVYALGATLMALLLGRAPFETGGDLVAMFYRVVTEPPPDLRAYGVPPPVADVLARALSKDPTRRWPSAGDFGAELRRAQGILGLPALPMIAGRRPVGSGPPAAATFRPATRTPPSPPSRPPAPPPSGWTSTPGVAAPPRRRWLRSVAILVAVLALVAGGLLLAGEVTDPDPDDDRAGGDSATTQDSDVRVVGIDRLDDGALQVQATFTSAQAATDGPVAGETCSNWPLSYRLITNVDGTTAYQIDGVADVGPGHRPC